MKSHTIELSEIVIPVQVKRLSSGEYLATSKVLNGLVAQGRTIAETLEIAQDVARKLIESCQEHGDPLPAFLRKQMKRVRRETILQIPVAVHA